MATVQDVLISKGDGLHSVGVSTTVLEATQLMNEHQIGAIIVTRSGQIAGIFTERDVLRRIVAEQRDPATTKIGDVMSEKLVCCQPDTPINDARGIMKERRIRHLPVCAENGSLVGMLSIGDLNAWCLEDGEITIQYMQDYIYGRV